MRNTLLRAGLNPAVFSIVTEADVRKFEDQSFVLFLLAVSLAFAWILQPFYGAVLWAIVGAVIFAPLNRELLRITRGRPSLAAAITVSIIVVIGLVDNILRPFLVGKDTKLPDYVVLISTLGGIEVFGLNGFVIGPLIAAIFMVTWEIFTASRQSASHPLDAA